MSHIWMLDQEKATNDDKQSDLKISYSFECVLCCQYTSKYFRTAGKETEKEEGREE